LAGPNSENMKFLIVATCLAAYSIAAVSADPAWNALRGSFLIAKQESFAPFPKTSGDALFSSENWTPTSGTDCKSGSYTGVQYIKNGDDYSVGLLYDVQGTVAGIQLLVPHSAVLSENNTHNYGSVPMYNNATYNDEEYFVLTAYFVHPSTICSTGRTNETLQTDGTGTGLWLQNGPTAESLIEVPLTRPEGDDAETSGWTQNNCFPAMGYHNFYRLTQDYTPTECTTMYPIFGLYGRNRKLHGFGFITPGTFNNPRLEHPPPPAIKMILGETPQCVLDLEEKIGVTSLHVYFTDSPWFHTCSIFRALNSYARQTFNWLRNLG